MKSSRGKVTKKKGRKKREFSQAWEIMRTRILEEIHQQRTTQTAIARATGMWTQEVGRYLSPTKQGDPPIVPGLDRIHQIAGALGMTLSELAADVPKWEPEVEDSTEEHPAVDHIADKIRHLPPEQRDVLEAVLESLTTAKPAPSSKPSTANSTAKKTKGRQG